MRSTAIQYVGIDVHQSTLVCVVKGETGQTTIESKVATRRETIEGFIRGLGSHVHVAFEEGTQAQWLYDILRPITERAIVCDARKIATKGNKDDRHDADRICELLRLNALHSVYHDHGDRTLRELVRSYEALVDDSLRVMLRIRAIYRSRAIAAKSRSVYHPARRAEWLKSRMQGAGFAQTNSMHSSTPYSLCDGERERQCCVKRVTGGRIEYCEPFLASVPYALPRSSPRSRIRNDSGLNGSYGLMPGLQ